MLKLVESRPESSDARPWHGLSEVLVELRELTGKFLGGATAGSDSETIDDLTKLVRATSTLARVCIEAEKTVTQRDLNALIASMGAAVYAHVRDPVVRQSITDDWQAQISEDVG